MKILKSERKETPSAVNYQVTIEFSFKEAVTVKEDSTIAERAGKLVTEALAVLAQ